MCMTQDSTGHHTTQSSIETVGEGFDARIRRRVKGDFGEEQQGFRKGRGTSDGDVRPETYYGTGQYGSGVRRPSESF